MKVQNTIKPRNIHAINPVMKKGGAHQKTYKSKRRNDKMALKKGDFLSPFLLYII